MPACNVCYRKCMISEGKNGFCGVRSCRNGEIVPLNYGRITSIALDPIEKKPLNRFMPGTMVLSVGSYGCNLRCPFCQNYEISWVDGVYEFEKEAEYVSPERLAALAVKYKANGNIGVAFTYNEPLIGYEFVRDTARLVHDKGMKNVLVSNGMASLDVLEEIIPYIDAMNIDLKGFSDSFYSDVLLGDRRMVMDFIAEAVKHCHVEITTLIIPGENDSDEEILEISKWIASLKDKSGNVIGKNIPLHISRFFPRFKMTDRPPTDVDRIYHLADIARKKLDFVYTGNC
ncbi:AmmeMemoRadiSam system radical SAM enzyme [Butyrivibrio sp. AE2015]|uniref:AmmeMemoRadiSam system radical SAM enzyme n=1 Tax=Butyrivibrio sp. AE2015 TaxID=1280663 RepID=UPI0003B520DD|nr:AmmeMemoRadiSam system radical SAM enzyme [Butyrivibrio sp. AE2015]